MRLEMPAESHAKSHQEHISQSERHEILPLESEELVDTHAGESPLKPDDNERDEEGLKHEPDGRGDEIHHIIETIPAGDVERHPTAEEHQGGDTRHDEEVKILSEIEETEMDTGILGVVAGGELMFSLGEVEGATIGFGSRCDDIDQESDECRYMTFEDIPAISLTIDDIGDIHRTAHQDDGHDGEAERDLV